MPIVADNIDTLILNVKLRQDFPIELAQQLDVLRRRARTQKKTLSLTSLVSGSSSSRFRRPAAAYAAVQKGASRLPKMEHERLKPHMTDPAYYWVSSFHCPFSKTYRVMPKHRTRLVPASPGRVSPGPRSPGQRSPLHRRFASPTNCRRAWLN